MKKSKIFFIIFIIVWASLIILNFIIPSESFSQQENRYLATIPEFNFKDLVSGRYIESMDNYINDHFIGRNFWLKLNSFMQLSTGKTENNGVYIGRDGYLFEEFKFTEDNDRNLDRIASAINEFTKNKEIPIYFMLIPNSIYINREKLPNNAEVDDQKIIINKFYQKLEDTINVDVTDVLQLENQENQIYFRTDHHMTSYGAYIVYLEFCQKANISAIPLEEFDRETVSKEFLGTFDSKAQVLNQRKDKIEVYKNDINQNVEGNYDGETYNSIFNSEYLKGKDKYSYFLNGNYSKVVIKTKVDNNKKLLVIKDSYAHIMSQFLCQNYEEVHFIDPRYYKADISEYADENNITDILFLYNLSNMADDVALRMIK